jgi:hypothetical protein
MIVPLSPSGEGSVVGRCVFVKRPGVDVGGADGYLGQLTTSATRTAITMPKTSIVATLMGRA